MLRGRLPPRHGEGQEEDRFGYQRSDPEWLEPGLGLGGQTRQADGTTEHVSQESPAGHERTQQPSPIAIAVHADRGYERADAVGYEEQSLVCGLAERIACRYEVNETGGDDRNHCDNLEAMSRSRHQRCPAFGSECGD
jgi:hypothetical protein